MQVIAPSVRLRAVSLFLVPLLSRAIGHARGYLLVSRFARRTTEKRETARSRPRHVCHPQPFRRPVAGIT